MQHRFLIETVCEGTRFVEHVSRAVGLDRDGRIGRCSAIPVGAVSGKNQRLIAPRPWTKNRRCGCKTDSFAVPDLGKTRAVHLVTGTGNRTAEGRSHIIKVVGLVPFADVRIVHVHAVKKSASPASEHDLLKGIGDLPDFCWKPGRFRS